MKRRRIYASALKRSSSPAEQTRHLALEDGSPLQPEIRAKMGARFGHDFSSVRIYSDSSAARATSAAGANALTFGNQILLGAGRYAPGSRDTERLLSHELAHVVQQERFGSGDPSRISRRDDPSEREARRAADLVAAGSAVQISSAPDAAVARDEDEDKPVMGQVADNWFFNNPFWNTITHNTLSTETSIAEEYYKGQVSADQMAQIEAERISWGDYGTSPSSDPAATPAEAPGAVSDANPSYMAMEPNGQVSTPQQEIDNMISEELSGTGGRAPLEPYNAGEAPLNPAQFETPAAPSPSSAAPASEPPGAVSDVNPSYSAMEPGAPLTPDQENINNMISEELGGTGGRAPLEPYAAGEAPLNPAEFSPSPSSTASNLEKAANAGADTEEALQTGSRFAKGLAVFNAVNKVLNPLGVVSNSVSLYQDIRDGNWADATADAAGVTGAGIGTAGSLGLIGEASALGPVGAAAGSFAGGYALGKMGLGAANSYAKNNNIFGDNRDSTETAGDAGIAVRDYLHSTWVPNVVGDVAGGAAAIGSSWYTAAYSGLHWAGSGIAGLFEGDEEVDQEALNQATQVMEENMDQIDAQETENELEESMPVAYSAHEELPPPLKKEEKK